MLGVINSCCLTELDLIWPTGLISETSGRLCFCTSHNICHTSKKSKLQRKRLFFWWVLDLDREETAELDEVKVQTSCSFLPWTNEKDTAHNSKSLAFLKAKKQKTKHTHSAVSGFVTKCYRKHLQSIPAYMAVGWQEKANTCDSLRVMKLHLL